MTTKTVNVDDLDLDTYNKDCGVAYNALKGLYVDNFTNTYGDFEDYHLDPYQKAILKQRILMFNVDFDVDLKSFFIGKRGKKYEHKFLTRANKQMYFSDISHAIMTIPQLEKDLKHYAKHDQMQEDIASSVHGCGDRKVGKHDEKLRMQKANYNISDINNHLLKFLPKNAYVYVERDINIEKVRPMTDDDSRWVARMLKNYLAIHTSLAYKLLWLAKIQGHKSLFNSRNRVNLWTASKDKYNYIKNHHYTIKSLNCLNFKDIQSLLDTYLWNLRDID